MSEYEGYSEFGNTTQTSAPVSSRKASRPNPSGVVKPPRSWPLLAAMSLLGSIALSLATGVSYSTFGLSLLACVLVVVAMFIDRSRSTSGNYSFESWFSRVVPLVYVGGLVASLVQIVLVAIDATR